MKTHPGNHQDISLETKTSHDHMDFMGHLNQFHNYPVDVKRKFGFNFHITGWDNISLGIHFCLTLPNFEIHLPFSFIRVGWSYK